MPHTHNDRKPFFRALSALLLLGTLPASAEYSTPATPTVTPVAALDASAEPRPNGTLDLSKVPKFVTPLVVPPVMPHTTGSRGEANYTVAVTTFKQQILPTGFPKTEVMGYGAPQYPGSVDDGGAFFSPGLTIENLSNTPTTVKWINQMLDATGKFLPHPLSASIDQTLHWANPAKDCADGKKRTDCMGKSPKPYSGPVPIITHVHGANVGSESDGYPEAWWLPNAKNIPARYARHGTQFGDASGKNKGKTGAALFRYPNTQHETTLFYHDHSLGITRLNVYAGMAGFWLIRDPKEGQEAKLNLPRPAPQAGDLQFKDPHRAAAAPAPAPKKYYEIPLAIQDRSFNADGSLFYPSDRAYFHDGISKDKLKIKFSPDSDIAPIWNPEAFFSAIMVNGRTWPKMDVDQGRYRLRLLNGCNARFLNLALKVVKADGSLGAEVPFFQIGSDQGLLPDVVEVETGKQTVYTGDAASAPREVAVNAQQALLMPPAKRNDVVVDFTGLPAGTHVRMVNTGPDVPFGGFTSDYEPANPATTGQIMEFVVGTDKAPEFADPTKLALQPMPSLHPSLIRRVSMNEAESAQVCALAHADKSYTQINLPPALTVSAPRSAPIPTDPDARARADRTMESMSASAEAESAFVKACNAAGGEPFAPRMALQGTSDGMNGTALNWSAPITENPALNSTEEWQIYNYTTDAHPVHLHLVHFQVVGRDNINPAVAEPPHPVLPTEQGPDDMVISYPGEITRIQAKFDRAGLYVWHCHILEHEDNEMMRPMCVGVAGRDCPANLF